MAGVRLQREPETNIVLFSVDDVDDFVPEIRARGVLINAIGPDVLRAVTHLDVSTADIERTLVEIRAVVSQDS